MPWPTFVTKQFELVTDESDYNGPFNTLLNHLFPASDDYQVAPQFKRVADSIDFTIIYIISRRMLPVFFVEVKTYLAYDYNSSRKQADDQMRDRFLDFDSGSVPIPKLYGISAMGTRFSVYEFKPDTRTLTPPRILPHPDFVTDIAPQARWNYDIMAPAGETKIGEIVAEIKEMITDLNAA